MSDSHDQSYYEIALTNRQVMSIFVVLLVCVLLSFLGGVWLARDAEPSVEMASTQSIVAAEDETAPLEALDFFTRSDVNAATAAAPVEKKADRERGGKADVGSSSPQTSSAKPAPTATGPDEEASRSPSRPADRQKVVEVATPRVPKPAEPTANPMESTGGPSAVPTSVVIQVFSSNEEAQALRVADQLRKKGYPAIMSPVEVAGKTLHRVRIGPYSDSDEAKVVAESVRRAFNFDTWITH